MIIVRDSFFRKTISIVLILLSFIVKFTNIREVFIYKLNQINHSFSYFNNHDLFIYILAMKDKSINNLVAKYCFDVLTNVEQL